MNSSPFTSGERITLCAVLSALACLLLSILLGGLGALYYIPAFSAHLARAGISMVQLRPLHTTFASAWIFLGCVACVYWFLFSEGAAPTTNEKRRFKFHMVCWGIAGLGSLVSLALGLTSGREYLGFLPVFSLFILVGWIAFAWTWFGRIGRGFWGRPVYVYMWSAGILYFIYTFCEGHAYLLPSVRSHPVADLQIQWKSCGSLVASFNQMVYGSLAYVAERKSGDRRLGQSKMAFALFGVGLLNSFTNSAHHTYHIPQSDIIKWVAFVVSMLEIVILLLVLREAASMMRRRRASSLDFEVSTRFIDLSKCWNSYLLTLALLISVPPLNSLIHGTHVVMAHAMGSEIAIDSYILLGAIACILTTIFPKREVQEQVINSAKTRSTMAALNYFLVGLVVCLLGGGLAVAVTRMRGLPRPGWMEDFPILFALLGFGLGVNLIRLLWQWLPLLRSPAAHKLWSDGSAEGNGAMATSLPGAERMHQPETALPQPQSQRQ